MHSLVRGAKSAVRDAPQGELLVHLGRTTGNWDVSNRYYWYLFRSLTIPGTRGSNYWTASPGRTAVIAALFFFRFSIRVIRCSPCLGRGTSKKAPETVDLGHTYVKKTPLLADRSAQRLASLDDNYTAEQTVCIWVYCSRCKVL